MRDVDVENRVRRHKFCFELLAKHLAKHLQMYVQVGSPSEAEAETCRFQGGFHWITSRRQRFRNAFESGTIASVIRTSEHLPILLPRPTPKAPACFQFLHLSCIWYMGCNLLKSSAQPPGPPASKHGQQLQPKRSHTPRFSGSRKSSALSTLLPPFRKSKMAALTPLCQSPVG